MSVEDPNGHVNTGCCYPADSEHPKECIWETVGKVIEGTMLNPNIIAVDFKDVEAKVLDPLDIPHEIGVSQCDASIRPGPSGRYSASCIQCTTAT